MKKSINVPLNKLIAWTGNVRKTDADAGIHELAASIAAHGLLQSFVVMPAGKGKTGKYAVIAGRRRYLALKSLVKSRAIESDAPIACTLASDDLDPAELSLAENIVRAPMHPADQFEAFRDLIDKGASVADVAARFSLAESVINQRLKLGRLSPIILAAYRAGDLGLEQAQAFALADGHATQERVFENLPEWSRSPGSIRRALTEGEIPADDRRVRFVGLDAYEAAGGIIRRDLFDLTGEESGGGYVLDEGLLERLVAHKLNAVARDVMAEGWKWVETAPDADYASFGEYARRYPEPLPLPEDEQAELDGLAAEYDELVDSDDEADAERFAVVEQRLDELKAHGEAWMPETLSIAGAIVSLGHDGTAQVTRGLVRDGDEPEAGDDASGEPASKASGLPATLVADLTAQKTAALRLSLAGQPDIALACVVHTLALQCLQDIGAGFYETALTLLAQSPDLRPLMAKPECSKALEAFDTLAKRLTERLPENPVALFDWCLEQPRKTLLELLALCAALSLNAVQRGHDRPNCERLRHAADMARAVKLDMASWFTPDAESFFGRISRAQILSAVQEAKGAEPAPAWSKLKKAELAAVATRQVEGTGWLPETLRVSERATEEPSEDLSEAAA
jgi:ParB family chromosome partitioning protein